MSQEQAEHSIFEAVKWFARSSASKSAVADDKDESHGNNKRMSTVVLKPRGGQQMAGEEC